MIADSLTNIGSYRGLSENIDKGINFLTSADLTGLAAGRVEIDGENAYALVQDYTTTPPSEKPFESHRNYVDIQVVASGEEINYWVLIDGLKVKTDYDSDKDVILYYNTKSVPLEMQAGTFAVFLPHDGHKPGCNLESTTKVRKIVVKCAV